jgi:PhnB protein
MFHLYVKNVDAAIKKAIAAGAQEQRPVKNQFYSDSLGSVIDPFGHVWNISPHVEDVSPKEIKRRFAELSANTSS